MLFSISFPPGVFQIGQLCGHFHHDRRQLPAQGPQRRVVKPSTQLREGPFANYQLRRGTQFLFSSPAQFYLTGNPFFGQRLRSEVSLVVTQVLLLRLFQPEDLITEKLKSAATVMESSNNLFFRVYFSLTGPGYYALCFRCDPELINFRLNGSKMLRAIDLILLFRVPLPFFLENGIGSLLDKLCGPLPPILHFLQVGDVTLVTRLKGYRVRQQLSRNGPPGN